MKYSKKIKGQLILQDAVADEVIFDDLNESDMPKIGDYAHDANNLPIDGTVLFPTGDVYHFKKGKLVEIILDDSFYAKINDMQTKELNKLKTSMADDLDKFKAEMSSRFKAEKENFHKILGIKQ